MHNKFEFRSKLLNQIYRKNLAYVSIEMSVKSIFKKNLDLTKG